MILLKVLLWSLSGMVIVLGLIRLYDRADMAVNDEITPNTATDILTTLIFAAIAGPCVIIGLFCMPSDAAGWVFGRISEALIPQRLLSWLNQDIMPE